MAKPLTSGQSNYSFTETYSLGTLGSPSGTQAHLGTEAGVDHIMHFYQIFSDGGGGCLTSAEEALGGLFNQQNRLYWLSSKAKFCAQKPAVPVE